MITLLAAHLATAPAHACGGFFCSGGTTTTTTTSTTTGTYVPPVVQDSERILFQVNDDGTTTAYVEVGYVQVEEVDFAWVIPVPPGIDANDVANVSAGMFNTLETLTAPQFTFRWYEVNYNTNTNYGYGGYGGYGYGGYDSGGSRGCGCGAGKDASFDSASTGSWSATSSPGGTTTSKEETFGVEVIEEAVVGPFAIEVIAALDGQDFAYWLTLNGYDLPDSAPAPLQHYIDGGMQFLGVKLAPDVPSGPIDTLVFTYPTEEPMIPIILTAIASANTLPITAYILADETFAPSNYDVVPDFADETLPVDIVGADYLARAEAELDARGGHAFILEYATRDTTVLTGQGSGTGFDTVITGRPMLTRWRGLLTPEQMTLDPVFSPYPGLSDYDNHHAIELDFPQGYTPDRRIQRGPDEVRPDAWFGGKGSWLFFLPITLLGASFRRRR